MRGLLSNEEEIVRGILMAHFPLLLRLFFFSESIVYSNRQKYFLPIRKKKPLDILKEKSLDCVRLNNCKELCLYQKVVTSCNWYWLNEGEKS